MDRLRGRFQTDHYSEIEARECAGLAIGVRPNVAVSNGLGRRTEYGLKLILSRKGFDSSSGGCASPILADGRMVSLPIPDADSIISYGDIMADGESLGAMVADLTSGRVAAGSGAHLDPDLIPGSIIRHRDWRPVFGQAGPAQGHLRNRSVDVGDLFLFFGLFRRVEIKRGKFQFQKDAPPRHVIWGWLRVGEIVSIDGALLPQRHWLAYHPHCQARTLSNNTLYIAAPTLSDNASENLLPGAGVFTHYDSHRQLTAATAHSVSEWQLPAWFYPGRKRTALSYHDRPERWRRRRGKTLLQAAARGQEFVLDCGEYPEALRWAEEIIAGAA